MNVELLFYRKNIEPNGDIVEMKIWQVPAAKDKPYVIDTLWFVLKTAKGLWVTIMEKERVITGITGARSFPTILKGWTF